MMILRDFKQAGRKSQHLGFLQIGQRILIVFDLELTQSGHGPARGLVGIKHGEWKKRLFTLLVALLVVQNGAKHPPALPPVRL